MQHLHMALDVASLPEAIAEASDVASYSFRLGKMLWEQADAKECALLFSPPDRRVPPPGLLRRRTARCRCL